MWRSAAAVRIRQIGTGKGRPSTLLSHLELRSPLPAERFTGIRRVSKMSGTKRKVPPSLGKSVSPGKKAKVEVLDYHLTPSVKDEDGGIQWPAPRAAITRARKLIVEWYVVHRF